MNTLFFSSSLFPCRRQCSPSIQHNHCHFLLSIFSIIDRVDRFCDFSNESKHRSPYIHVFYAFHLLPNNVLSPSLSPLPSPPLCPSFIIVLCCLSIPVPSRYYRHHHHQHHQHHRCHYCRRRHHLHPVFPLFHIYIFFVLFIIHFVFYKICILLLLLAK